jgi:ribose transport system substrate-binding protein
MIKSTRLPIGALVLAAACGGGSGGVGAVSCGFSTPGTDAPLTIAVIPKGTSHVFWQSIHAGAAKAAQELGVSIVWRGPLREDDRDSQISEVEGFISRGVSGIVLAPLDDSALVAPVLAAQRQKIPVVIFDSGLKSDEYVSFVATDNVKGGRLGGEALARRMNGKGKVVLLRYAEGHDSTSKREQGFLEAMQANPGIQVVSSNQYGGADVEGYYKKAEALLGNYKAADGTLGIDGIFCPNESSTFAMMRVLQDNGWAGKVKFVGFDASSNLVKGLSDGHIDGLVVQDPVKMGYESVKAMVAHIRQQPVEKRIDTGVRVATRETMNEPEMKELLQPDLSKWLKD